jgi:hypothetical protein
VPKGRPREGKVLYLDEVLDLALFYLPTAMFNTPFMRRSKYAPVPSLRREPRVDASGLKARRSKANRRTEDWVDVQTITFGEEVGRFIKI